MEKENISVSTMQPNENISGRKRSSIEFPYADLDASLEIACGVHNAGGISCEIEQLAAQVKLEANGGGFRLRLNAARIFGLITYDRGGRISLTDIGRQAIDSQSEHNAKTKAFLAVPLFGEVYEKYKGSPLPPKAAMEQALVTFGVAENVKSRARQVLERSARQAGFFATAPDRLVKPRINDSSDAQDDQNQQSDLGDRQKGGSLSIAGMHPAFQLLLQTLPEPGCEWEAQQRMNWLMLANSTFNMIYKPKQGDVSIQITLGQY